MPLGAASPAGSPPPICFACGRLFLHEKIPQIDTVPSVRAGGTAPRVDLAGSCARWVHAEPTCPHSIPPRCPPRGPSFTPWFCREGDEPGPSCFHVPEPRELVPIAAKVQACSGWGCRALFHPHCTKGLGALLAPFPPRGSPQQNLLLSSFPPPPPQAFGCSQLPAASAGARAQKMQQNSPGSRCWPQPTQLLPATTTGFRFFLLKPPGWFIPVPMSGQLLGIRAWESFIC